MALRKIDESYVYLPLSQTHKWTSTLLAPTEGDPTPLLPVIGQEVRRVDASLPVMGAPLHAMISMNPYCGVSRIGGLLARPFVLHLRCVARVSRCCKRLSTRGPAAPD